MRISVRGGGGGAGGGLRPLFTAYAASSFWLVIILMYLWCFLSHVCVVYGEPKPQFVGTFIPGSQAVVKIGGIFERNERELELAFRYAIDKVNDGRQLASGLKFAAKVQRIKPNDSFHAARIACELISEGVWAIFGPKSPAVNRMLRSLTTQLHMPHISVVWDYHSPIAHMDNRLVSSLLVSPLPASFTFNFHPEASALGSALLDFIVSRGWKSFTLVYEEYEGLIQLKDLLRITTMNEKVKMRIKQFAPRIDVVTYRKLFKDINKVGELNIVLAVPLDRLHDILAEAKEVGMMTEYHNYLIASLDLHMVDLSAFRDLQTNITALSILDPHILTNHQPYQPAGRNSMQSRYPYRYGPGYDQYFYYPQKKLNTEQALIYDAVDFVALAADDMMKHLNPYEVSPRSRGLFGANHSVANCSSGEAWSHGKDLVTHMHRINKQGLSGEIRFDEFGQRVDFDLGIVESKRSGLQQVGTWNARTGINVTANFTEFSEMVKEILANRTLRVTTALARPYMMLKTNHTMLEGNDRFEGYCVDLLDEIAAKLKFKYVIHIVKDGKYGSPNSRGEWNGMVRELQEREADLAITDFTITSRRQSAVDFTMPFMNLGISILFKKPEEKQPEMFQFLKPFSTEVWLYIASAFIAVSLCLWLISRMTPYEWVSPHPCDPEPEELENDFSLGAAVWFVLGSIMQQGSDLAPKALSTRSIATVWWFFTLIMISSYTANLAAFLTISRMASPIESAEDLAKQTTIHYGAKKGGSTRDFFRTSKHQTYQRMWAFMESTVPSVFPETNDLGIDRVKKGSYAFLMESSSIKYIIERECDLTQIGGELDSKGYGIALPFNSPYRDLISLAIVQLKEKNKLRELEAKWWIEMGGGKCYDDGSAGSAAAAEMDMGSVGGVFVALVIGVLFSCFLVVIEFIWKQLKFRPDERGPIWKEFLNELKRIFTGGGSTRPVPGLRDQSKSSGDSGEDDAEGDRKQSEDTIQLQPRKSDAAESKASTLGRKESASKARQDIDEYYERRKTLPLNSKEALATGVAAAATAAAVGSPSGFGPYSTSTYIRNQEQFVPDDLFNLLRRNNYHSHHPEDTGHLVMMVASPANSQLEEAPKMYRSSANLVLNQPRSSILLQHQFNNNE